MNTKNQASGGSSHSNVCRRSMARWLGAWRNAVASRGGGSMPQQPAP